MNSKKVITIILSVLSIIMLIVCCILGTLLAVNKKAVEDKQFEVFQEQQAQINEQVQQQVQVNEQQQIVVVDTQVSNESEDMPEVVAEPEPESVDISHINEPWHEWTSKCPHNTQYTQTVEEIFEWWSNEMSTSGIWFPELYELDLDKCGKYCQLFEDGSTMVQWFFGFKNTEVGTYVSSTEDTEFYPNHLQPGEFGGPGGSDCPCVVFPNGVPENSQVIYDAIINLNMQGDIWFGDTGLVTLDDSGDYFHFQTYGGDQPYHEYDISYSGELLAEY